MGEKLNVIRKAMVCKAMEYSGQGDLLTISNYFGVPISYLEAKNLLRARTGDFLVMVNGDIFPVPPENFLQQYIMHPTAEQLEKVEATGLVGLAGIQTEDDHIAKLAKA